MVEPIARGPVHVVGEVVASEPYGAWTRVSLRAEGVGERVRPGTFVALDRPAADPARQAYWVARVRPSGPDRALVDVVVDPVGPGSRWLAGLPVGARLGVTGPLGRPFALPKDPVTCLVVGEGRGAVPVLALAERLAARGCTVHVLLAGATSADLHPVDDLRRTARSVTVATGDGSVGLRGRAGDVVAETLARTDADVVYAAGPAPMLRAVAEAAQDRGVWSQVALEPAMPCGTGLCFGCEVPVRGEDGIDRRVRGCTEGPVLRGDRVLWEAVAGVAP